MSLDTWNRMTESAAFGTTMLLAGTGAMLVAVALYGRPDGDSRAAFNAPIRVEDGAFNRPAPIPYLSGHAVFNQGRAAEPSEPRASGSGSRTRAAPSDRVTASATSLSCHPVWHPLETGPIGRRVIELCPNQPIPPLPKRRVDPSHDKLPTEADLLASIALEPLVTFGGEAQEVGENVALSLEQSLASPAERSAPTTAPSPLDLEALDWRPHVLDGSPG
jgi:hypothetical protein